MVIRVKALLLMISSKDLSLDSTKDYKAMNNLLFVDAKNWWISKSRPLPEGFSSIALSAFRKHKNDSIELIIDPSAQTFWADGSTLLSIKDWPLLNYTISHFGHSRNLCYVVQENWLTSLSQLDRRVSLVSLYNARNNGDLLWSVTKSETAYIDLQVTEQLTSDTTVCTGFIFTENESDHSFSCKTDIQSLFRDEMFDTPMLELGPNLVVHGSGTKTKIMVTGKSKEIQQYLKTLDGMVELDALPYSKWKAFARQEHQT